MFQIITTFSLISNKLLMLHKIFNKNNNKPLAKRLLWGQPLEASLQAVGLRNRLQRCLFASGCLKQPLATA
jgi:hypothetical protein